MIQISGRITTVHSKAHCVAPALTPDNLTSMTTTSDGNSVTMTITGTQIRSVIASVDDYLMNLAIAEDTCSSFPHMPADLNKKHLPDAGHTPRKEDRIHRK